jgi:hypothetical protein
MLTVATALAAILICAATADKFDRHSLLKQLPFPATGSERSSDVFLMETVEAPGGLLIFEV